MGRSGWFPIQTIRFGSPRKAMLTARFLREEGVWPALQFAPPDFPSGAVLRFFITARHTNTDIDWALDALSRATRRRIPDFEAATDESVRAASCDGTVGLD